MLKRISNKRLRVFVIIILIALIAFALYSANWFYFYFTKAKPLLEIIDTDRIKAEEGEDHSYYSWNINNGDLNYRVSIPDFLRFNASYTVLTPTDYDKDGKITTKYSYGFYYYASFGSESMYHIMIHDYSNATHAQITEDGELKFSDEGEIIYDLYFDKDFNLIEGSDKLYNEHKKEIDRLFENSKEVLGEDALK